MKRILSAIFVVAVLSAPLAYFINKCPDPFIKYEHPGGIAYYKQGPIPIFAYEVDAKEVPFSVSGKPKSRDIIDIAIFAVPKPPDSISTAFKIGANTYSYIKPWGDTISNKYFSVVFRPTAYNPPADYKGLYYFKFSSHKTVTTQRYSGNIAQHYFDSLVRSHGYLETDAQKLDSLSPIEVSVISKEETMPEVPVYINFISAKVVRVGFTSGVSSNNRTYTWSNTKWIFKNQFFEIKIRPRRQITADDMTKTYYFKFAT